VQHLPAILASPRITAKAGNNQPPRPGEELHHDSPETSSSMLSYQAKGINKFTCVNLAGALQQLRGAIFLLAALVSTGSPTATAGCCAAPVPG
jgi:hypothetical protein